MNKKVLKLIFFCTVAFGLLVGLVTNVNPQGKSLHYILLPIVLTLIVLYSLGRLVQIMLFKNDNGLFKVLIMSGSIMIVLLLLLSGIGQLQAVDVILVSILAIISSFYFYRSWA